MSPLWMWPLWMAPPGPAADTVTPISPGGRGTAGGTVFGGTAAGGGEPAGAAAAGTAGGAATLTTPEVPRADPAATTAMIAACPANDATMIQRRPRRQSWRAPFPAIPHQYPRGPLSQL